jgi:hypothetical protein
LELQAQSDAAREVFSTKVSRGFISKSRRRKGGCFSELFQQPVTIKQQFCVPNLEWLSGIPAAAQEQDGRSKPKKPKTN